MLSRRIKPWLLFVLLCSTWVLQGAESKTLAERLGYDAKDKLLIINGDDAGMCHSANLAVFDSMENGLLSSATIMVPCPWFPEIAAYASSNPSRSFGIHLCHTSEWKKYRWGPIASRDSVSGLIDASGYLWPDIFQVYSNATPRQAMIEGRAQIRKALDAGIDVTHLDSHMGTLQLHPDYMKVYLQLAVEFNLPVRMASQATLASRGFPAVRDEFAARGIVFPDYFVYEELKDMPRDVQGFWKNIVRNLKPGVTELYIHPAIASDETRAITGTWSIRDQEYEVFTKDQEMKDLIKQENIKVISFRPLRDLQRRQSAAAGK